MMLERGLQWWQTIRRCISGSRLMLELDKRSLSTWNQLRIRFGWMKHISRWREMEISVSGLSILKATAPLSLSALAGCAGGRTILSPKTMKVYAAGGGQSPVAYGRRSAGGAEYHRKPPMDKMRWLPRQLIELKPIKLFPKLRTLREIKYLSAEQDHRSSNGLASQSRHGIWLI